MSNLRSAHMPWLITGGDMRTTRHMVRAAVLVGVAYYIGAKLGIRLTYWQSPLSTFWIPNALLLAAFLLLPVRTWPAVVIASLPAHLLVLTGTEPLPMVLCWFVSNTSEALIGAIAVRHFASVPFRFDRIANVAWFVLFAVIIGTVLSSFLDAGFVTLNGESESGFRADWQNRVFANALATSTVVPFIIAWASGLAVIRRAPLHRWLEGAALALVLGACMFAFSAESGAQVMPAWLYLPLPLLLWATVRFGPIGESTAMLGVVLTVVWSTSQGAGPFQLGTTANNALVIQLVFTPLSITLLSLAAVIEERRKAQATAQRKTEQLQMALDAAHMAMWDWPVIDAMPSLATSRYMLHAPQAESHNGGSEPASLVHAADVTHVNEAVARSIRQRAPLQMEYRVVLPDGNQRWLLSRGTVVTDVSGRPVRMIGLTADITERKTAEALRTGENRILEMIVSGAALGDILDELVTFIEAESRGFCSIVLVDADGVRIRHGAAPSLPEAYVRGIEGLPTGPAVGSCGTAIHRRERVIVTDIATDPLWEKYRDFALQYGLRACWSTPIISTGGRVLGAFATYYREPRAPTPEELRLIDDATQIAAIAIERKRSETEVHEQRRALTHLSRVAMLGELSAAIAHELNQPLTAVLSNAQAAQRLLRRDPPDIAEVEEILVDIVAADRRASEVIAQLRPLLMKGQVRLNPVAPADLLASTLKLARADLTAREVNVVTTVAERVPPVLGDQVQLQQVLLNLIINGCDAMSDRAPADRNLTIRVRRSQDDQVEFAIADSGTGIPEELIDRIFDPFYSSKEHGLGMGLAICRSIALAHHGKLWAANNESGGAVFCLVLPGISVQ
jgi:signal transduction histidine kinase/integral membrane sensor domain MASE1